MRSVLRWTTVAVIPYMSKRQHIGMNNFKPEISLFFPAYNEEENISASIDKAVKVLENVASRYEIIVVNDGSADRTSLIAQIWSKKNENVRVIDHSPNLGYGAALWSGISAAKYEWIFFTDADLQFRLEEIKRLLKYAPKYSVILGYRRPRRDPFMRLVNAWGWNLLNRILFGLKVRDIDCAFKLFKKELVAGLPIQSRGATFSAEMLIRLSRNGVIFKEVPVTHLPRERGSPTGAKPAVIVRAFKELFRLYRGDLGRRDTEFVQAGKFGLVGVINTLVDIVTYYMLTRYVLFFASHIVSAKFVTFMFGTICSFFLNRRFTFRIKTKTNLSEILKFYTSIALTVLINVGSLYILNSLLGIYDLVAVGLSTVITFMIGFLASKSWVFKKSRDIGRPGRPVFSGGNKLGNRINPKKIDWQEVARNSYN